MLPVFRTSWRLSAAVVVGVVAVPLVAAAPSSAEETAAVAPVAEATYRTPIGLVPGLTRAAGALHVGAVAGQETDRAYLRFALPSLPDNAVPEFLFVKIPVAADGGTLAPEQSRIRVCVVPEGFQDGGGGDPPPVDCGRGGDGAYDASSATVSIEVSSSLAIGNTVDLALVPQPDTDETWHVAFDGRQGDAPPTLAVRYTLPLSPSDDVTDGGGGLDVPSVSFSPEVPYVSAPEALPPPAATGEVIARQAPAASFELPAVAGSTFHYAVVFAFPLALLIGMAVLGEALVSPVEISGEERR